MSDEQAVRPTFILTGFLYLWGAFFLVAWFVILFGPDGAGQYIKDWHCIWSTGGQVLLGNVTGLYPGGDVSYCSEGLFWLYPPYALYPAALLALLPLRAAYFSLVVAICVCTGLSAQWLREHGDGGEVGNLFFALCL